jgi:N-acetylmuramoyl-L-alanine amidase
MITGNDFVALAKKHLSEKYVFGQLVPKNNSNWKGPWDCAEFTSWLIYQLTNQLYGCYNDKGDPGSADSYTGYWGRDAEIKGIKISINEAAKTSGAFLLRLAANGSTGHVVLTDGNYGTIEAYSSKYGIISYTVHNRRWDFGIILPGIDYTVKQSKTEIQPPVKTIYRFTSPMMHGDIVTAIQKAILNAGFNPGSADGWYGLKTYTAVRLYQDNHGLNPDGEVGPITAKYLKIST